MVKKRFYAVVRGKTSGAVYDSWAECEPNVKGISGAMFKGFSTRKEAEAFLKSNASASPSGRKRARDDDEDSVDSVIEIAPPAPRKDGSSSPTGTQRRVAKSALVAADDAVVEIQPPNRTKVNVIVSTKDMLEAVKHPQRTGLEALLRSLKATIYVDGACEGNGQKGATGGYGVWYGRDSKDNVSKRLLPSEPQTNNRAEMKAVMTVLANAAKQDAAYQRSPDGGAATRGLPAGVVPVRPLEICSDSSYTITGATVWMKRWLSNGFRTAQNTDVLNQDLWKELHKQMQSRKNAMEAFLLAVIVEGRTPTTELQNRALAADMAENWAVRFQKVKAHSSIEGNEGADALAVAGARLGSC